LYINRETAAEGKPNQSNPNIVRLYSNNLRVIIFGYYFSTFFESDN